MKFLKAAYCKLVLDYPAVILAVLALAVLFFGYQAQHFRLDASSDSLSLKNDRDLKYYRAIKARYGSDDYLVVTYTPKQRDLFDEAALRDLKSLRDELAGLEPVESVLSIFDVPLLESPPLSLEELSREMPTLLDEQTDKEMAHEELRTSPFYSNLLMSEDGETTALFLNFKSDDKLDELTRARDDLREKAMDSKLSADEKERLKQLEEEHRVYNKKFQDQWQEDVAQIRNILRSYEDQADLFLGGVPMIVADSISYVANDLKVFGGGLAVFLVVLLALIFRRARWVFLPGAVCVSVGICVIGFLGLVNWPVTVVSSNFIALLLIFTLSFCVHQIVRYRECVRDAPEADQRSLVYAMVSSISAPCFYMVSTTIVAFGSLVISDIQPIIDFGRMMAIGLCFAFVIAFTLLPALLVLLDREPPVSSDDVTDKITGYFAGLVQKRGKLILAGFFMVVALSVAGISMLYVQNRFIDYYKQDTDIYQGMVVIDRKLGGTTPLDVIVDAPQDYLDYQAEEQAMEEEDGYGLSYETGVAGGYWLGPDAMEQAGAIHRYLDSLPETGKVLSFYSALELLQRIKDAKPMDRFYLGVLYNKLPADVKEIVFDPYISEDGNQLRFGIRVYESREGLDRQALLNTIRTHLTQEIGLADDQVHMTGMVVLYNNVLQTLFSSQIATVWVVFVIMFLVFIVLFRNIKVASVAIIPNITVTAMVLGLMGWLGIPLDIMTITIAAIAFGAADDNTIHYVHRMMNEHRKHGNYRKAVQSAHSTIGRAVYYTSVTVILGFSILAFSNFVPTIYFGLLTGFAMLVALLANLVLLPLLMVLFKPMGPEAEHKA